VVVTFSGRAIGAGGAKETVAAASIVLCALLAVSLDRVRWPFNTQVLAGAGIAVGGVAIAVPGWLGENWVVFFLGVIMVIVGIAYAVQSEREARKPKPEPATKGHIDELKDHLDQVLPTDRTRLVARLTTKADYWDRVLEEQEQEARRWMREQTPKRTPSSETIEACVRREFEGVRRCFEQDRLEIKALLRDAETFYLDSPALRGYLDNPPDVFGGFQNTPIHLRDLASALNATQHDNPSPSSVLLRLAGDLRAYREYHRPDFPYDDTSLDDDTALAYQRRFLVRVAGAVNLLAPHGLTDPDSTELWSWPENMGQVMLTATTFECLAQNL
jgi:hypothetical protein